MGPLELLVLVLLPAAGIFAFAMSLRERRGGVNPDGTPLQLRRRWSVVALVLGALMILIGILGIELASNLRPTAGNALSNGGEVLDAEQYGILKLISWVVVIFGAVVGIGGITGLTGRQTTVIQTGSPPSLAGRVDEYGATNGQPTDNAFCESCGRELPATDRFCGGCGAEQPLNQPA